MRSCIRTNEISGLWSIMQARHLIFQGLNISWSFGKHVTTTLPWHSFSIFLTLHRCFARKKFCWWSKQMVARARPEEISHIRNEIEDSHNKYQSWISNLSSLPRLLHNGWRFIQPKIQFLLIDEMGCWEMGTANSSWPHKAFQIDELNYCLQTVLQ